MKFKKKIKKIFRNYFAIFLPTLTSIIYLLIKSMYISKVAKYYKLPTYYFEHLCLDNFLSTTILFSVFIIIINFYNLSAGYYLKHFYFIFYFIISIYYILVFTFLVNNEYLSLFTAIFVVLIILVSLYFLRKIYSIHLISSLILIFIYTIISFHSIQSKKEYEFALLDNYEKVIIITLQANDYLITKFSEENNTLIINTSKRKWINRLDILNISSKTYDNIEIINN